MTKQEQIKEIDKQSERRINYCVRIQEAFNYKGNYDHEDIPSILVDFEREIKNDILSKDSVVLSRGEYEKLKHYEWRVTSGVCMTQKEWFDFCNEDSNRRTCLRIEEREKERKETAEKILFKFESAFAYYDNEDIFSKKAIFECLEEIVKSLGVEIKEYEK